MDDCERIHKYGFASVKWVWGSGEREYDASAMIKHG